MTISIEFFYAAPATPSFRAIPKRHPETLLRTLNNISALGGGVAAEGVKVYKGCGDICTPVSFIYLICKDLIFKTSVATLLRTYVRSEDKVMH